jgi:hypothetical protein
MKFWERFLRIIFELAARPQIKRLRPKLIESVLAKSSSMFHPDLVTEIRSFILSKQTTAGGFADRGGKCDLYYTLFGYFVAEAYSVEVNLEPLREYIKESVTANNLSGVHRYCGAILYAKMIGIDSATEKLRKEIVAEVNNSDSKQLEYSRFMGIMALYYLGDFLNIYRIVNRYKKSFVLGSHPCPVIAATAILLEMAGNRQPEAANILKSFYRENGGFAALHRAPDEDLLSTGVALYALNFLEADLRLIKPDCLAFVDNLYEKGGFRATLSDNFPDVEYTFYGLLALGSLS